MKKTRKRGHQDSNLNITEPKSVALPFGNTPKKYFYFFANLINACIVYAIKIKTAIGQNTIIKIFGLSFPAIAIPTSTPVITYIIAIKITKPIIRYTPFLFLENYGNQYFLIRKPFQI